jgi:hypothetical protein
MENTNAKILQALENISARLVLLESAPASKAKASSVVKLDRATVAAQAATLLNERATKPKKDMGSKITQLNDRRAAHWRLMQSQYREQHGITDMTDVDIRKRVKKGELPPYPTYANALADYSRVCREKDPEAQAKYEAYRAKCPEWYEHHKQVRAEVRVLKKIASSVDDSSSVVSSAVSSVASAPAPIKRKKPLKVRVTSDEPPRPPIRFQSDAYPNQTPADILDEEEFIYAMLYPQDGKTYLLNKKYWVIQHDDIADENNWCGILKWSRERERWLIDTSEPEPTD